MASADFAEKYGLYVQIAVMLLFFFETLMVSLFKAILVFHLRFEAKHTESRAILTYHLFQIIAYLSAYLNGLVAMQSVSVSLVLLMIQYVISAGCLAAGFMVFQPGDFAMPFVIALFGLGHGALKSVIHRMLKVNLIGKAFAFMSLALLVFEVVLVATLPMGGQMESAKMAVLGLLGVVFILLLVSILGSLFDNHDLPDHKLSLILSCTYTGFIGWLTSVEADARELAKKKKETRKKVTPLVQQIEMEKRQHWLDRCLVDYPAELVQDLKTKFRLHKFYFSIAGLWIAVEMKYSYWIFNTYFTDRVIADDVVIQPPQYIAMTPLVFVIFGPLFYLLIRPVLTKTFYYNSLRQMCLGAFIIVVATGLSWKLSAMQWELTTEFMEADSGHQKVRILNAYDCESGFAAYFPMDPDLTAIYRPMPALDIVRAKPNIKPPGQRRRRRVKPLNATERERYVPKTIDMITNILLPTIDQSFLRYANVRFLDQSRIGDVLYARLLPTNSFTYLMAIDSLVDHAVTLSSYGYCDTLDEYTLKIPQMNNKSEVDQMLVYLIHNQKKVNPVAYHAMDYKRDLLQKPGIRIITAYDVQSRVVNLIREGKIIMSLRPEMKQAIIDPPSPRLWLRPGDGKNLIIQTFHQKLQLNYTLRTAELVDIVVATRDDGSVVVKLLQALRPITISGLIPVAQYVIIPFGEFLLGIVGLQQLVALVPDRMRYSVHVDWYLILGFSNLVIVAVSQIGLPLLHQQVNRLSILVLVSFISLLLMTARY